MQDWNESDCLHGTASNKHGVGPTEEKVQAVCDTEAPPTNVAKRRSFPGTNQFQLKVSTKFCNHSRTTTEVNTTGHHMEVGQGGKQSV